MQIEDKFKILLPKIVKGENYQNNENLEGRYQTHINQWIGRIEFNKNEFTSIKNIKLKIKKLIDPFNRNAILKVVKLNNSYPKYVLKNKKKLKMWIA